MSLSFFFFLVRTFKFYSFSNFNPTIQFSNYSYLVAMLYVRSLDLSHLIAESSHHFTNLSLLHPPPSPWQQHFYSLFLSLTFLFFLKIPHISNATQYWSFSVWFISLSKVPSNSIQIVSNGRIFLSHGLIIFHCVKNKLKMD